MYKVLLVEDEAQIRAGLKTLIEDVIGHFRVAKDAKSAVEALAWITTDRPDVIVTDIRMKEMSGLDMIERVRDLYPDIPIVIISGYDEFEYAQRAIRYKVEEYLLKPIDRVELAQIFMRLKHKLDGARAGEASAAEADREGSESERKIILDMKAIVQANLDRDLSLQFIADKLHMNPQYLSALFKAETGRNFVDYVAYCRMERAKQLLRETNLKIYEVARLSGYENEKYFITVFKQLVGVTPGQYRQNP